ncbi:MAG: integrin alpha [Thermoplasmata archaeon]
MAGNNFGTTQFWHASTPSLQLPTPVRTYINVSVTRDNGQTWVAVGNGSLWRFTNDEPDGKIFRYRIELSTTHAAFTPLLYNITFSFNRSRVGVIINGVYSLDGFGYSVSGGGDYNGDGYPDIVVGAPFTEQQRGRVYVFYGNSSWTFNTHLSGANADIILTGKTSGDRYGYCVYGGIAHIFNLTSDPDWLNEICVGAPGAAEKGVNAGRVYVLRPEG